ncbi:30S ribosomal protein S19 [bacterium]|nr:30S ribosomal protein S19 [bacterium]
MSRSTKKGPYVHYSLIEKIDRLEKSGERKVIRTWSRASMIVPEFLGHNFEVYNGKRWFPVFVTEDLVGHRFGEFAPTRAFRSHIKDERKGKK